MPSWRTSSLAKQRENLRVQWCERVTTGSDFCSRDRKSAIGTSLAVLPGTLNGTHLRDEPIFPCEKKRAKPNGLLVLVSSTPYNASTSSLSTSWSTTNLQGILILWLASRLDAFSGYPFRTWLLGNACGKTTETPGVRPSRSSRTRDRSTSRFLRPRKIGTELSHDVLNPARVPL